MWGRRWSKPLPQTGRRRQGGICRPIGCGCCSQRWRAPLSYRQAQSSGSGVITAQATETPEICPVFNVKSSQGKITLWKTNALRTPHRSSQRVQEFSSYMPQMLAFVSIFSLLLKKTQVFTNPAPICVTAPQINGEGTETLCMTFLYKKRKITAPKTKCFKRAFPFVLRGLAIF